MKNTELALELLHKLLGKNPVLDKAEINLLKKHDIKLIALNKTQYSSEEFNKELSRIRDILLK